MATSVVYLMASARKPVSTEEIENLVLRRESKLAVAAIQTFLQTRKNEQSEHIFKACDWYRRLGLFEKGFRLLKLDEPIRRRLSTETFDGMRTLWAARFLNLLGSAELAIPLLNSIEMRTYDDHRIAGSIYLTHFDFDHAVASLERMQELDKEPSRYLSRLATINLADAHAGAGRTDQAIVIARKIFENSSEALLKAIARLAEGEYWARSANWAHANEAISDSEKLFPASDRTSPDYSLLLKWKAYVAAKQGETVKAKLDFDTAFSLIRSFAVRPEAWLDVLRLRALAGLLDKKRTEQLLLYPGLSLGFQNSLHELGAPKKSELKTRKEALGFDLAKDEYLVNGKIRIGIPTELRALALISLGGDWGVPSIRLKSLLWPEEPHAFMQMDGRLRQIQLRLRSRYGTPVSTIGKTISIDSVSRAKIFVTGQYQKAELPPSFLTRFGHFKRSDVEKYYGLSTTQAWARIRLWSESGWCEEKPEKGPYYFGSIPFVKSNKI